MNLILTPAPAPAYYPKTWPTYADLVGVRVPDTFTLAGHECHAPHDVTFTETTFVGRTVLAAHFPRLLVPRAAIATQRRDFRYAIERVGAFGVLIAPLDWDIALAQAVRLPRFYALSDVRGLVATGAALDALIAAGEA